MATRTVTGTILESDGTPWVGGAVTFALEEGTFNAVDTFPVYIVATTTDADGKISAPLEAGLGQRYRCTLPDHSSFNFALPAGTGSLSIEYLRGLDAAPVAETNELDLLIEAHAALHLAHGALTAADLGTGTPDGTKYLRDDLTWQTVAAGGVSGGGTASRLAQWSGASALGDANLIGPASNVLTLEAAAASTLGLAISAGKTLTLTATDNFNLTVPATGTAALLGVANIYSQLNSFSASANVGVDGTTDGWLRIDSSYAGTSWFVASDKGTFSGHDDPLLFVGYNCQQIAGTGYPNTSDITFRLGLEAHYWPTVTDHYAEGYFEFGSVGGSVSRRPYQFIIDQSTNNVINTFTGAFAVHSSGNATANFQVLENGEFLAYQGLIARRDGDALTIQNAAGTPQMNFNSTTGAYSLLPLALGTGSAGNNLLYLSKTVSTDVTGGAYGLGEDFTVSVAQTYPPYALILNVYDSHATGTMGTLLSTVFSAKKTGAGTSVSVYGVTADVQNMSTGQMVYGVAGQFGVLNYGGGVLQQAKALQIQPINVYNSGSAVYYAFGLVIQSSSVGSGASLNNLYGIYIEDQNVGTNHYAILTNAGNIVFNNGGDAGTDFTVKTDAYDGIFVDASNDSVVIMSNAAGKVALFGVPAVTQPAHIVDADGSLADITTKFNTWLGQAAALGLQAAA